MHDTVRGPTTQNCDMRSQGPRTKKKNYNTVRGPTTNNCDAVELFWLRGKGPHTPLCTQLLAPCLEAPSAPALMERSSMCI